MTKKTEESKKEKSSHSPKPPSAPMKKQPASKIDPVVLQRLSLHGKKARKNIIVEGEINDLTQNFQVNTTIHNN